MYKLPLTGIIASMRISKIGLCIQLFVLVAFSYVSLSVVRLDLKKKDVRRLYLPMFLPFIVALVALLLDVWLHGW